MKKERRQARPSIRASTDAAIHRKIREQSLRVPWRQLADACDRLVIWQSFGLWVRAIVEVEGLIPEVVSETLEQRCPGFLQDHGTSADCEAIWLDLSAWIDDSVFADAVRNGWIDVIHYYSGRDSRLEAIWTHWGRTAECWRHERPERYPSFDHWHSDALTGWAEDSAEERAIQQYIEWEAFAFWARLRVAGDTQAFPDFIEVMEQRCPGFLSSISREQQDCPEYSTWFWKALLAWIEGHAFGEQTGSDEFAATRDRARTHLRGERIAAYWADCSTEWLTNPPHSYPGPDEWLEQADAFTLKVSA